MNHRLIDLKTRKLELLRQKQHYLRTNKLWLFRPYDWQQKWWAAGKYHRQRLLMAANQVGKTAGSCVEFCYHLTGIYPDGWEGHVFRFAINAWALGVSAEQIKKVLQERMIGNINEVAQFEGGYIPAHLMDQENITRGQLKGSVKEVHIKHAHGGWSKLSFLSYEQGQHVLMGPVIDLALIDEEPRDPTIYPQVLTRTLNGDQGRGGLVMLAFTPENGITEVVHQFTEDLKPGQYLQNVTWEDAPHLTEEKKTQMLEAYPAHQREMRSKGIPMLGSGQVYPIAEERLYDDCDEILPHWRRINAIDFGVRHCGIVFLALDADADVLHLYDATKVEDQLPRQLALLMRSRGDWIPWAWPHDGHLPDRGSGLEQQKLYVNEGVTMLSIHAQSEDGKIIRETGITRLWDRMQTGRLKVSRHLKCFFEEKRLYHRRDGLIVKKNDHVLDALRYGEMMLRYATTDTETNGLLIKPSYLQARYR
jgi:phage terminase large subunit-like protein